MYVDIAAGELDWIAIYRLCIGFVTPRPIALVSTISPDGKHNLAPFSFYNMVSANPPIIVLGPSLRRDGSAKHTLANIEATGQFAIATVTENIGPQMAKCAADLEYGTGGIEIDEADNILFSMNSTDVKGIYAIVDGKDYSSYGAYGYDLWSPVNFWTTCVDALGDATQYGGSIDPALLTAGGGTASMVPEPTVLGLLTFGGLALLRGGRRFGAWTMLRRRPKRR